MKYEYEICQLRLLYNSNHSLSEDQKEALLVAIKALEKESMKGA